MHWRITARREFDRLLTSRGVIAYTIVLSLAGILLLQLQNPSSALQDPQVTTVRPLRRITPIGAFLATLHFILPVAAVLFGYRAISKERETGSLRLTLGVPQSRRDVLVGIFTGRFAVLTLATVGGYLIIIVVGSIQYAPPPVLSSLLVIIPLLLTIAAHLAVGIGLSSLTRRSSRAAAAALVYVFVSIFWVDWLSIPLYTWLSGTPVNIFAPPADPLFFALQRLLPTGASNVAANWVLTVGNSAANPVTVVRDALGGETNAYRVVDAFRPNRLGSGTRPGVDAIPVYLHPGSGFLILGIWCFVMLTIGYFGFRRADLTAGGGSSGRFQRLRSLFARPVDRLLNRMRGVSSRSWAITAHREVTRLLGSRGMVAYLVLLVLAELYYINPSKRVADTLGPMVAIGPIQRASALVILPTALIFGYRALSNERESGTITISAGVPQSRRSLLAGILAGRFGALGLVTLAGYLIILPFLIVEFGTLPIPPLLLMSGAGLLYLAANLAFAFGLSSLTAQNGRSAAVSFVYFILLGFFWVTLFAPILYTSVSGTTIDPSEPAPAAPALYFLQRLTPYGAFNVTANWIFGVGNSAVEFTSVALGGTLAFDVSEALTEVPLYLEPVSGPIILLLWCLLSVGIGYLGFRRAALV